MAFQQETEAQRGLGNWPKVTQQASIEDQTRISLSIFCFTTRLPCYPEIHPSQVILTPADGYRLPMTLGRNRINSFRKGAAFLLGVHLYGWHLLGIGSLNRGMVASGTTLFLLAYRASHWRKREILVAPAACVLPSWLPEGLSTMKEDGCLPALLHLLTSSQETSSVALAHC